MLLGCSDALQRIGPLRAWALVPGPGPWALVPGPGPWSQDPVPGPWSLVPGPGPWSLGPRALGPSRNQKMVFFATFLVLAFKILGSGGTW